MIRKLEKWRNEFAAAGSKIDRKIAAIERERDAILIAIGQVFDDGGGI